MMASMWGEKRLASGHALGGVVLTVFIEMDGKTCPLWVAPFPNWDSRQHKWREGS